MAGNWQKSRNSRSFHKPPVIQGALFYLGSNLTNFCLLAKIASSPRAAALRPCEAPSIRFSLNAPQRWKKFTDEDSPPNNTACASRLSFSKSLFQF
jgi:hypothetical protein